MSTAASTAVLDGEAVAQLRSEFRGQVLEPEDAGFDDARHVFNGMFADRRPRVVLRPAGAADVIRAIGFATMSGLPLAIRGGGHSVAGFSTTEGGIVLDMSSMKGIRVDPERRTVRAQPGLVWGEVDRETQAFGLAVTGGRVTNTGITGFTLGTGSGWLERKMGYACDNLVRADVVTAAGELVTASEDENAELLWGLRGGGGNFGVVTELEFRLAPVGPIVYAGMMLFPLAVAAEAVRTWRDVGTGAAEDLGSGFGIITAPPEEFVPEEWRLEKVCGVLGLYAGTPEDAERTLKPLRDLKPFLDLWQPMPYTVIQGLIDEGNPFGRRNYWRAHNLTDLDDSVIDTYIEAGSTAPSPFTATLLVNLGGAVARVGEDDTAVSGRSAPFAFHLNGMWEGAEADEGNIAWVRRTSDALGPHIAEGVSLNFASEVGESDLQESFGAAKVARLRALKDRYDPGNFFRLNQNIKPTQ
jgi:FAD/FMN-containing dehydrogenase